ncbi:glycosyltransferase family 2 protein [Bacillus cytotoxicus]|uniref:glycosyltransferase family 2 protein n=1 Tax=Bacillus cereus group sp. BfR-BA-01492 TaxID=2920361 RepID=UPI001F599712|nr:glycosyltransferase [Bacillus cereus group sp. BfR-BA-01492]EMA6343014.1 glycosyltransferase [Bacillus cytotoxicus]
MKKSLTAIIVCSNQLFTLEEVIKNVKQLNPIEIIVLCSHSQREVIEISKKYHCLTVFENTSETKYNDYSSALKIAKGDVCFVLHGSFLLSSEQMKDFLVPILHDDTDAVLNKLDGILPIGKYQNLHIVWRKVLNEFLGRPDLKSNSLLSLPFALTKEVVTSIGYDTFKNLLLSHIQLLEQGWRIRHHCALHTLCADELLEESGLYKERLSKEESLEVERYLLAISNWLRGRNVRGGFTDGGKRRDIIEQLQYDQSFPFYQQGSGVRSALYNKKQLSVIIPAQNEEKTIERVIHEVRKIEPLEVIVVVNGSSDQTATIASRLGTTVIEYKESLGHNVGRAIGAFASTGDILLFVDADFSIPANDLSPYVLAVAKGTGIALNHLTSSLKPPFHIVDILKYMLNLSYSRPDLSNGSLVAIPHAISRECIEGIGWESLVCPSFAQVKAILEGYKVECVHYVDVIKPNRFRLKEHFSKGGHPPAVLRIMGDHIEALSYLIKKQNLSYE